MTEILTRLIEEYSQHHNLSIPSRRLIADKVLATIRRREGIDPLVISSEVPLWMLRGHFYSCQPNITFEQLVEQAAPDELVKAARRFFTPPPRLIIQL